MSTQQLPQRNFRVNYRGGFALPNSTETVNWLVDNNTEVLVVETVDTFHAYADACRQFTHDEWARNPYVQPVLPKLMDVLARPYRLPNIIPKIPARRFFAVAHRDYVGLYDNIKGTVEFLNYFSPVTIKELSSSDDAILWLNKNFVLPMLAISAYVTDDIPYILNLPLNTAVPVYFAKWWSEHIPLVNEIPFRQPEFLALNSASQN